MIITISKSENPAKKYPHKIASHSYGEISFRFRFFQFIRQIAHYAIFISAASEIQERKSIMQTHDEIKNLTNENIMNTYSRYDITFVSGSGSLLTDVKGKKYIDFGSGIGVNILGHGNSKIISATGKQLKKLMHTSNLYYTEPMAVLAAKLNALCGTKGVFFSNSGAEANEGAIKLARKYGADKYGSERSDVITLTNSFHGRTITTLAATGQDSFHEHFNPLTKGFIYCEPNDAGALKKALKKSVCAVMIELIQGEGGVFPLELDFIKELKKLTAEKDILIIADEVQTGVGRTGTFLACEQYDLKPDIITLAKGLGGGFPIGAVLCNEKLEGVLGRGQHGSTFGANPVCCAAADAVLDIVGDKQFLDKVFEKGEHIKYRLSKIKGIGQIRGRGLMIGFDIPSGIDARSFTETLLRKGLLALTAKTAVRLLPPLNISMRDLDRGLDIIKETMEEFYS